jgi:hypothetical protein
LDESQREDAVIFSRGRVPSQLVEDEDAGMGAHRATARLNKKRKTTKKHARIAAERKRATAQAK